MNTKRVIGFGMIALILVSSCKKTTVDLSSDVNKTGPDVLIAGKDYNYPESYKVDVDKDGVSDFELVSVVEHCPCIYTYGEASITCLNTHCYIGTRIVSDTTYVNSTYDTIQHTNGSMEYRIDRNFVPHRINNADTIKQIQSLHYVATFAYSHLAVKNSQWEAGSLVLGRQDYEIYYAHYEYGPGWEMHEDYYFFYHNTFPADQFVYIAIRKDVGRESLLGWIKLKMTENYKMTVSEVVLL
jgi:hypothetical protein